MIFRKIIKKNLNRISKLQSMKTHPIGVIGKKDVRINKLIDKLYKRKALNE